MYKNNKILITICARGGSKGVLKKNIRPLAGKPLIAHTIEVAKELEWADRVVVSTDDDEIKSTAEEFGIEVPFLRPKKLSDDVIGREIVIAYVAHLAEAYWEEEYDIIVDLGVATPLKTVSDVREVVKMLVNTPQTEVVFSVTPAARNPYFNMVELNSKGYAQLSKKPERYVSRRQDSPQVYDMNDGVYAMWKKSYMQNKTVRTDKTRIYPMPPERSIDIDREIDFKIAELFISERDRK